MIAILNFETRSVCFLKNSDRGYVIDCGIFNRGWLRCDAVLRMGWCRDFLNANFFEKRSFTFLNFELDLVFWCSLALEKCNISRQM
jgi:hypothetical protein